MSKLSLAFTLALGVALSGGTAGAASAATTVVRANAAPPAPLGCGANVGCIETGLRYSGKPVQAPAAAPPITGPVEDPIAELLGGFSDEASKLTHYLQTLFVHSN